MRHALNRAHTTQAHFINYFLPRLQIWYNSHLSVLPFMSMGPIKISTWNNSTADMFFLPSVYIVRLWLRDQKYPFNLNYDEKLLLKWLPVCCSNWQVHNHVSNWGIDSLVFIISCKNHTTYIGWKLPDKALRMLELTYFLQYNSQTDMSHRKHKSEKTTYNSIGWTNTFFTCRSKIIIDSHGQQVIKM